MLRTLLILSIIAVFALLPTLYVRYVIGKQWKPRWRYLTWAPLAILVISSILLFRLVTSAGFMHFYAFWVGCVVFPAFAFTLVSAIGWGLARKWPKAFRIANYTGLVACTTVFVLTFYGTFFGWKKLEVKQVDVYFDNLPEQFEEYRIVQLSDFHVGTYGHNPSFVNRVVEQTNALQPDLIVFTGDLVNLNAEEIDPFEPYLSQLTAKDGVYAVLGNHDYCRYGFNKSEQQKLAGLEQVKATEKVMGWRTLVDEHVFLHRGQDSIALAGVGNVSEPPYLHAGDLNKALQGLSDSVFTILLSHDPVHWRMEVLDQSNVTLMLAGHTHAAQLKIGAWSPAAFTYKEWSGLYQQNNRFLHVSEGLGGTFPFRLGATPQIIVLTLHRQ